MDATLSPPAPPPRARMALAPALVPILPRAGAPAPRARSAAESAPPRTAAPAGPNTLALRVAALHQLADGHAAHIRLRGEMHQHFLAAQRQAQAVLLARWTGRAGGEAGAGGAELTAAGPPVLPAAAAVAVEPTAISPQPPLAASNWSLPAALPGPRLERATLEALSRRELPVSAVFGPRFQLQDSHQYQIRTAAPPLLFTRRVLGIEGEPGAMGRGRIWAESLLQPGDWGLDPSGRYTMLAVGEAAQANMLLASWVGADLVHDGSLRYRLLDMDMELVGPLPAGGEVIDVEVSIDRHAHVGGMRLVFFRTRLAVAGELRLRARFTAGLFSGEMLARPESIRWDPAQDDRTFTGPFDLPARRDGHDGPRSFGREALAALAEGRVTDCFGPGFRRAATQLRSPLAARGADVQLEAVESFEPSGGPWGRGYLRAVQAITPEHPLFALHLPGDPCLPGFLLLEGARQAAAFHLTALGSTLGRDGWRFEPVRELSCRTVLRGQVVPCTTRLVYEVFVESFTDGPHPTLVCDVTVRMDSRIIFHARRFGLRLVPDWPLEHWRQGDEAPQRRGDAGPPEALGGLAGVRESPDAVRADGVLLGRASMLALGWGRAEEGWGPGYQAFDDGSCWPRLPAPPMQFVSRATRMEAEAGRPVMGAAIEVAYDVPASAWYFRDNAHPVMPFWVQLEAALQPCGLLLCRVAPGTARGLLVRNLDGRYTQHGELPARDAVLTHRIELLHWSDVGGLRIAAFRVRGWAHGRLVHELESTFGAFHPDALREQAGLPTTAADRTRIAAPQGEARPLDGDSPWCSGALRLPGPRMRMVQQLTALAPSGGPAGLGWVRGDKEVDPAEWFFRAHFFQDPVQPGSLGLEALLQLVQVRLIAAGAADGLRAPRFEPFALGRTLSWKYRGQVRPEHERITTEVAVTALERAPGAVLAVADGALWVDGVRVYEATGLAVRVVEAAAG